MSGARACAATFSVAGGGPTALTPVGTGTQIVNDPGVVADLDAAFDSAQQQYLVVWHTWNADIKGLFLNAQGQALGGAFLIDTNAVAPRAAYSATSQAYLVTYTKGEARLARTVTPAGGIGHVGGGLGAGRDELGGRPRQPGRHGVGAEFEHVPHHVVGRRQHHPGPGGGGERADRHGDDADGVRCAGDARNRLRAGGVPGGGPDVGPVDLGPVAEPERDARRARASRSSRGPRPRATGCEWRTARPPETFTVAWARGGIPQTTTLAAGRDNGRDDSAGRGGPRGHATRPRVQQRVERLRRGGAGECVGHLGAGPRQRGYAAGPAPWLPSPRRRRRTGGR